MLFASSIDDAVVEGVKVPAIPRRAHSAREVLVHIVLPLPSASSSTQRVHHGAENRKRRRMDAVKS